jgi:hypothetical protein
VTGPSHRPEIAFSAWMPVAADHKISYWYVSPDSGRVIRSGGGYWMAVKRWIAAAAITTGQDIFTASGGSGDRRWQRLVTCTQAEADKFFQEAIRDRRDHGMKRLYRRACNARLRRLDRESRPA